MGFRLPKGSPMLYNMNISTAKGALTMNKKSLFALLLVLVLVLAGCALNNPDADRNIEIIRVGDTVYTKGEVQDQMAYQLSYMSYVYAMLGQPFDPADEAVRASVQQDVIDYLVQEAVLNQKVNELGLAALTEEEQTALDAQIESVWQRNLEAIKADVLSADPSLEGEALDAAITARCKEVALSRESIVDSETTIFHREKLYDHVAAGVTITEEEVQAAYDAAVAADQEAFTADPDAFGTLLNSTANAKVYYRPAGYRMVKQILVPFAEADKALIDQVTGLIAQQQPAVTDAGKALADLGVKDETALLSKMTVSVPQPALVVSFGENSTTTTVPVVTEAPAMEVTASFDETVDEATAAAANTLAEAKALMAFYLCQLSNAKDNAYTAIAPEAAAILAQLKDGADWNALMAEKTADPGMQQGAATAETGYAVCAGYAGFDKAFVDASMALRSVGDVSPATKGEYGYYIIQYAAEVPAGSIALDEVHDDLSASVLTNKQQAAFTDALAQWTTEANPTINYDKLK